MKTDKKPSKMLRAALLLLLLLSGMSQALAWDTEPDENGLYDGVYSRPTYFPDWTESSSPTWLNTQMYLLSVRFNDLDGIPLENYEVVVYDAQNELRSCSRSITEQNHYCVLSVKGDESDYFHFQVIYGDFDSPTIVDVPDVEIKFKSNEVFGDGEHPYVFVIPGRTMLSETVTGEFTNKTGVDVTVKRTINANEWSTICLPFAIDADHLESAFGTSVQLGDFTGCDVTYEDDEETVQNINVKFEAATAIEAHHPYIIKVADKVTEINADGVDIVANDEVPSVDCDRIGKGTKKDPYKWNSLIGNYENGFFVPEQTLFLSGGKFWYSMGNTTMMAYRAYFDFYDILPEADTSGARISLSFTDDDSTTHIGSDLLDVRPAAQSSAVFDLQGRRVSDMHCKKGIYISNGKKILIK